MDAHDRFASASAAHAAAPTAATHAELMAAALASLDADGVGGIPLTVPGKD